VISKTEPFATSLTVPEAVRTRLEKVWPEMQDRLVDLGPETPHILAAGSDHYVQIHDPDLVVSIVRLIFERARVALDLRSGSHRRPYLADGW